MGATIESFEDAIAAVVAWSDGIGKRLSPEQKDRLRARGQLAKSLLREAWDRLRETNEIVIMGGESQR